MPSRNALAMSGIIALVLFTSSQLRASSVDPTRVDVTPAPTCQELGYDFEIKRNSPTPGATSELDTGAGIISVDVNEANDSFNWSSQIGIDAAIVKGGPGVNIYRYDDEEAFGDTALNAPLNLNNNTDYGLSFVAFCFDYEVQAALTTDPSYDQTWEWALEKTSNVSEALELSNGQLYPVTYTITTETSPIISNFTVTGTISVNNPAPIQAEVTGVSATLTGDITADVDCGVNFPVVLEPLEVLECTYSAVVPDISDRTVTATIETTGNVGGATVEEMVVFEGPTSEFDECVTVNDTNAHGPQNIKVCADDEVKTFTYDVMFGLHPDADVELVCGENEYVNTATMLTNDNAVFAESSATVLANIDCPEGCTLTQGYWKTHSSEGPAPYDDAWSGNESRSLQGLGWLSVLWTPPQKGNAWFMLAHQYIAAWMNYNANEASAPDEVIAALSTATTLLDSVSAHELISAKGKSGSALREQFISLAGLLDSYNNGAIGPGHCSE